MFFKPVNRNRTVNRKKNSVRLTEPKILKKFTRLTGFSVRFFGFSVRFFGFGFFCSPLVQVWHYFSWEIWGTFFFVWMNMGGVSCWINEIEDFDNQSKMSSSSDTPWWRLDYEAHKIIKWIRWIQKHWVLLFGFNLKKKNSDFFWMWKKSK